MKNSHIKAIAMLLTLSVLQAFHLSFASSPYIDKKNQTIKALSQQSIQQLLAGDGMGFALAAELNEYPGPKHVLELQTELSLSKEQVKKSRDLFKRMNHNAKVFGKQIIQAENELERLFQTGKAAPDNVKSIVAKIAQIQSKLRSLHLVTHIHQLRILTPDQNHRYQKLRGYSDSSMHSNHQSSGSHSKSHKHSY